jgi:toxin YoeB
MTAKIELSIQFRRDLIQLKKENPKYLVKLWDIVVDLSDGDPFHGLGLPEPLKGDFSGYWSRRITQEHRLIYKVQEEVIVLISCFGHYI